MFLQANKMFIKFFGSKKLLYILLLSRRDAAKEASCERQLYKQQIQTNSIHILLSLPQTNRCNDNVQLLILNQCLLPVDRKNGLQYLLEILKRTLQNFEKIMMFSLYHIIREIIRGRTLYIYSNI